MAGNKNDEEVMGLDEGGETEVDLLCVKDDTKFTVSLVDAKISTVIAEAMKDRGDEVGQPLEIRGNITGDTLRLVVEYMQHHAGTEAPKIPKPMKSRHMKDECQDPWDAEFIDKAGEQRQVLYDLMSAANFLSIDGLLHLGCAKVGSMIKGQPLNKLKAILDPKINADPEGAEKQ